MSFGEQKEEETQLHGRMKSDLIEFPAGWGSARGLLEAVQSPFYKRRNTPPGAPPQPIWFQGFDESLPPPNAFCPNKGLKLFAMLCHKPILSPPPGDAPICYTHVALRKETSEASAGAQCNWKLTSTLRSKLCQIRQGGLEEWTVGEVVLLVLQETVERMLVASCALYITTYEKELSFWYKSILRVCLFPIFRVCLWTLLGMNWWMITSLFPSNRWSSISKWQYMHIWSLYFTITLAGSGPISFAQRLGAWHSLLFFFPKYGNSFRGWKFWWWVRQWRTLVLKGNSGETLVEIFFLSICRL